MKFGALTAAAALALVATFAAPADARRGDDTCLSCKAKGDEWFCPSARKCHSTKIACGFDCTEPCEKTDACTHCDGSGGFNCSCTQCRDNGFSAYCPAARECYHSRETCDISCGSVHCVDVEQVCAPKLSCSANNGGCNAATETCCMDESSKPFCAPGANRTCCNYKQMTCGQDQVCDPGAGRCVTPSPRTTNCKDCQIIARNIIEKQSCAGICANITEKVLHTMCELVVKLGICQLVVKHVHKEYTPARVCEMIGLCGDASGCECGYCTPQAFGQWCLAMPNRCPMGRPVARRSPATHRKQQRLALYEQVFHGPKGARREHFCMDGYCDESNAGCCLTCV